MKKDFLPKNKKWMTGRLLFSMPGNGMGVICTRNIHSGKKEKLVRWTADLGVRDVMRGYNWRWKRIPIKERKKVKLYYENA